LEQELKCAKKDMDNLMEQAGYPLGELHNEMASSLTSASMKWLEAHANKMSIANAYAHQGAGTARGAQLLLPGTPQTSAASSQLVTASASSVEAESGLKTACVKVLCESLEEDPFWGCPAVMQDRDHQLRDCKKFWE
jgi:hypothetical protein